jgi:membrane protease YdiL (CAAX protease family)
MSLLAAREAVGWAQAADTDAAQSAMNRALNTFDPDPGDGDPAWLVTTPAISGYFGIEPDYSDFSGLQGNLQLLFIFIGLSWVLAAIGEEVCFRGFLMKRIALVCGGGQWAWIVSLVASSILFGWGHTEQGVSGWVQEGLSGFLLGILFLAARRNLIVPIIAHGVSNTLAFVLIYFGNYPGIGVQAA